MQSLPLAIRQRLGLRDIKGVAIVASPGPVFVSGEPAKMPSCAAAAVNHHKARIVIILDAQVVAGAEPETLRTGGEQPERDLLDACLELGSIGELPARVGVMHGVEAIVPAVLGREGKRSGSSVKVCTQQFKLQAAGRPVVEPAIVEPDGASWIKVR